jgi:hypothetical protein
VQQGHDLEDGLAVDHGVVEAPHNSEAVRGAPLGGRLTAARAVETRRLDLELLRKTATAECCTVNDFVLYLIGTALRRYLIETNPRTKR